LIIDELGYLPIDKLGADLLFQIISQRYERAPMVITTNRPYKHWSQIFNNDSTLTSAILDRVLHHVDTVGHRGQELPHQGRDRLLTRWPANAAQSKSTSSPSPSGPFRSIITTSRRPWRTVSRSSLTRGSIANAASVGWRRPTSISWEWGRPISTPYSISSKCAFSASLTGAPLRRAPAQSTDSMPPSSAIARVIVPVAAHRSSPRAL